MSAKKKLYRWIDIRKLNNFQLSKNENAIDFLKSNPSYIHWYGLSSITLHDYQ